MHKPNVIDAVCILVMTMAGCASTGGRSGRPPNSLAALKKAAKEESESAGRFSRKAVSDSEMLKGQSAQEYRDSVVP